MDFVDLLATNTSLTIFASCTRVPTQHAIFATCRSLPGLLTLNGINSETYKEGHSRKLQHEAYRCSAHSLDEKFTAYRREIEKVGFFKYLGRILMYDDNDIHDDHSNLNKACTFWRRISNVLQRKNMSPKVYGMFYKATIQAVLLYGSKSWNLTTTMMKKLEGFHITAVYWMARTHRPQENNDGS